MLATKWSPKHHRSESLKFGVLEGEGGGGGAERGEEHHINNSTVTASIILRSSIPCLAFFFIYGINGQLGIVPRASDAHCVTLHNVSSLEQYVFHFELHKIVSEAHHEFLDILSAVPYLLHYLIPVVYPLWLHYHRHVHVVPVFLWLFGCVVWFHYLIWFLLPTAPPWFYDNIERYRSMGVTVPPVELQPREGCAFARIDRLTGVLFFHSLFAGNPVPFASFPSGHVAWPMCILLTLPSDSRRRLFLVYILWVSWATMYTCHHYFIDILAAILIAVCTDRLILWFARGRLRFARARISSRECGNKDDVCHVRIIT